LGSALQFFRVVALLKPTGLRVIAAQAPDYWTPNEWCAGFALLMREMNVRRAHIFAQGLSGYLSLYLVRHFPHLVASLVLANAYCDTIATEQSSIWLQAVPYIPAFVLLDTFYNQIPKETPFPEAAEFVLQDLEELTQEELASRIVLSGTKAKAPSPNPATFNPRRISLLETFIAAESYEEAAAQITNDDYAYPAMQALSRTIFAEPEDEVSYGAREGPSQGVHLHPAARARLHKKLTGVRVAKLKYGGDFPHLSAAPDVALHILLHLQYLHALDSAGAKGDGLAAGASAELETPQDSLEEQIIRVITRLVPYTHGVTVKDPSHKAEDEVSAPSQTAKPPQSIPTLAPSGATLATDSSPFLAAKRFGDINIIPDYDPKDGTFAESSQPAPTNISNDESKTESVPQMPAQQVLAQESVSPTTNTTAVAPEEASKTQTNDTRTSQANARIELPVESRAQTQSESQPKSTDDDKAVVASGWTQPEDEDDDDPDVVRHIAIKRDNAQDEVSSTGTSHSTQGERKQTPLTPGKGGSKDPDESFESMVESILKLVPPTASHAEPVEVAAAESSSKVKESSDQEPADLQALEALLKDLDL